MKAPDLTSETKRLIIRPYQKQDYENWYTQFSRRLPSQSKYDEGYIDMSRFTKDWFSKWVQGFREGAKKMICIFWVFFEKKMEPMLGLSSYRQYYGRNTNGL